MPDYNSLHQPLILKEYGRNVQKLVEAMRAIPDKNKRTTYAQELIKVMATLEANTKNGTENVQKHWDDLYIMANYDLDLDGPYPVPDKAPLRKQVHRPSYPQAPLKFRNYGRNVEYLIQKAIAMTDPATQEKAVLEIIRLMKSFSNEWNNESIAANLKHMSGNQLLVDLDKMKTQKILTAAPKRYNKRRKSS